MANRPRIRGARGLARGSFRQEEQRFLEIAIQEGSDTNKKQALQRLCQLLRRGLRSSSPHALKASVLYALQSHDPKVKRWAFNALALIGNIHDVEVMNVYWRNSFDDAEIFEAGLTALAQIVDKPTLLKMLSDAGVAFSPQVIMALAQHSGPFDEELSNLQFKLETATSGELRSATLLIGLQRAPANLFSDRHPVSSIIGELNDHDDKTVSQYSFWATAEHPDLDLSNVRVPPNLFSQLRPNVQAWAYRVLTKNNQTAETNYDFIVEGSESEHSSVREGLAMGLRDIFYDSLDALVIDWSLGEEELSIREKLWEHMAVHAAQSAGYREEAEKAYRSSSSNSPLRARLEAACKDQGLSMTFKRIALQTGEPDLFTQIAGVHVTNNNQTFEGPVQAAAISNAGPGNTGTITIGQQQQAITMADAELKNLLSELKKQPDSEEKAKVTSAVQEAIKAPNKTTVGKVVDWLKSAKEGMTSLNGITDSAGKFYLSIAPLINLLPNFVS